MKVYPARISILCAAVSLAACATSAPGVGELDTAAAVAAVSATPDAVERLRMDVAWLADDAREGREAGSRGYVDAAHYVAARLESVGVEPGANGEWFQEVPLRSASPVLEAAAASITTRDGSVHELKHLDDFTIRASMSSESSRVENAEAVFIGYGVHAPAFGHDDYANADLNGKVAVVFSGAPDIFDNESRAHFNSTGLKYKEASDRGAIGMVMLNSSASMESLPWDRRIANPSYTSMSWIWPDGRAETSGPNIKANLTIHPDKAALLFDGAEQSYETVLTAVDAEGEAPESFDLAVRISMAGGVKVDDVTSPNVVGLIPGADSARADEFVILTGHLDHTGVNQRLVAEGKDGINNGAMDNAVGIASLLEVARRLTAGEPPARSVLIVAVTAEEKGLLGADYFAHFPTIGDGEMVANVNLDMPVLLHDFTDVIAFGAERSSIGPIMERALEQTGVSLQPDPIPQLGIFTRSDHYRFVEQGVPSIFLWTGFSNGGEESFWDFYRNHYHRPSDEITLPIRYDQLARFAEIKHIIADAIANAPERPRWNEGDFFGDLFAGE
jgi:Zn-dependent M28 family amino/carboxypeptidase